MKRGSEKAPDKDTTGENPPEKSKTSKNTKSERNFDIGSRLEACDARGNWYAAKVENIRWDSKEVFIHFDGWSTKYNEWISMKSERLRSVQKPPPKRPPEKFAIGEKVLALWSAYHKSPATVKKVLADGKYEVLFHDGYVKRIPHNRMWHMDDAEFASKTAMLDIGSKQDRRNRKRKHIVADLFRSNKKPRPSRDTSFSESIEKKSPLTPIIEEPSSSAAPSPNPAPQKVKQPISSPIPFEVSYLDGHTETWTKFSTRRAEGKTAGKLETVISSPTGRKFRSKSEIVRFCDENKIQYEPKLFDFSAKKRNSVKPEISEQPEIVPVETKVEVPVPIAPEPEIQKEKLFIGGLEVVVEDGQFICPVSDCRKHFRKENLLHMHTKHYHPDLSKFLDYTPSVTDLAYARTVSILEQDNSPQLKSSLRQELRSAEVKRSPSRIVELKPEPEPVPQEATDPIPTESTASASETKSEQSIIKTEDKPIEPEIKQPLASNPLPRPLKPHWKRRPYHRNQLATTDWYGRMGKRPGNESTDFVDGADDLKTNTGEGGETPLVIDDGIKYDKLKGNEIINCSCLVKEEDGLMIQCDVCLCWQHGHCQGISPQSDVSESYICSICKDPPRGRTSRKFYNHQDWMKQGILPTLPFQPKQPSPRKALLKRAFEVSGQLSLISRLLHSLRVKLSVAANKDHPKLWLWAKKWQEEENPVNTQPDIKEEEPSTPKAPEPEKPIDPIECKLNLLDHILHYQDLVQARLDSLETVVTELEGMEGNSEDDPETVSRISATIKMLLRDLDTVKKWSVLP